MAIEKSITNRTVAQPAYPPLTTDTTETIFECDSDSVSDVTSSNDAASIGNSLVQADVTGVTRTISDQLLGSIHDPLEVVPADETEDAYPFPPGEMRPCWRVYEQRCGPKNRFRPGVYFHGITAGSEKKPPRLSDEWICAPLHIVATTRDRENRSYGMLLRFQDKLGEWKVWNMPARLLVGRGVESLLSELLDQGLETNLERRFKIASYINGMHPDRYIWAATQVGWYEHAFVLPHEVIGDDEGNVFFQSETVRQREYAVRGSLEQWRRDVASLCIGNPLLLFCVSAAFAGALLKLCSLDGAGFHLFGPSSSGKSTGSKAAASVWGSPTTYIRTWKATANGLEGAACLFNDGLLVLDEINDGDPREIQRTIYALGNGKGKQRANVTGSAKGVRSWRILTLSNGEKTIETYLSEAQLSVKPGQLMRLLQIPALGKHGAFDELHGCCDGRTFSDRVSECAAKFHGAAGIAFLKHLTTTVKADKDIGETVRRFAKLLLSNDSTPQVGRAATSFAVVAAAGELATSYGLTGWQEAAAFEAARICFARWREHFGEGRAEHTQIRQLLTDFIQQYGDSRFSKTDEVKMLNQRRAGYWRQSEDDREWLLNSPGLKDAVKGFDIQMIVTALTEANWLIRNKDGKPTHQIKVHGQNGRYYVIRLPSGIET